MRELFDLALELAEPQRAAFVRQRTVGRPALATELERLLAHHDSLGSFLERPYAATALPATEAAREPDSSDSLLLPVGVVLGDYEIDSYLGGGGGGQVYRARQRSLGGRRVAVKVLSARRIGPGDRLRFLRGARMAAEIDHPHLAQVYDCGEDSERGLLFYSMRLVEGPTLQELLVRLQESVAPQGDLRRQVVARCREVAEALAALHEHCVIHQDVKPANILIEGAPLERPWDGRAVLVDFGLVKRLDTSEVISTVWATLPYAAPEVLLNRGADARADVYALGLCLYDLLSGAAPGGRQSSGDVFERLSLRCTAMDPDLEAVVHRAIESTPMRRYADGGALAADLGAWLEKKSVRARRLTRVQRTRRWLRHHSESVLHWLVRGAAALSIVALLLVAAFGVQARLGDVRAARGAWVRGDLALLADAESRLPDWLERFGLPANVVAAMSAIRSRSNDPVARVQRTLGDSGTSDALLLVARFLERDGLASQPFLVRFLAAAMEPAASTTERSAAVHLAARLFTDRPDESAEDLAASAPLRARLEALLAEATASDDGLYALSALTGCGDGDTLTRLAQRLATRTRASWVTEAEELRLMLRALEWILLRSQSCGFLQNAARLELESMLEHARDAVRAVPPCGTVVGSPLTGALSNLFVAVAVTQRAAGLPISTVNADDRLPDPVVLEAVRCSPSIRERRLGVPPLSASTPIEKARRQGLISGLLDEPDSGREGRALAAQLPGSPLEAFDEGYSCGLALLVGQRPNWSNDEESRLGAFFELEELEGSASEELTHRRAEEETGILARWNFMAVPSELSGKAVRVETRCTTQDTDAQSGYLRLAVFGISKVRLAFALDPASEAVPCLHVVIQKSARFLLPGAGNPKLGVELDGRIMCSGVSAPYLSDGEAALPLYVPADERGQEHVAELLLLSESDAPLRIYEAWITEITPGTAAVQGPRSGQR